MKHFICFMLSCGMAMAAPVTIEQARTAASNWASRDAALGHRFGAVVAGARTCSPENGLPFFIVRFEDGGLAVLASDTEFSPVIAFSDADDLVESDDNPFWALLLRDAEARGNALDSMPQRRAALASRSAEWDALLTPNARSSSAVPTISDVRVAPLVQSEWGQSTVGNKTCYNYYTPNNYYCGCVATAGAQVMRYFEWPRTSMPQYTCNWCQLDDDDGYLSLTTQGGIYDWSKMPLVPTSSISLDQRMEIGKLTSDLGICCGMWYTYDGSGTGVYMLTSALHNQFGYSNAIAYIDDNGTDAAVAKAAIVSNLDAGLPVVIGISELDGYYGGHAIVGDGYGYMDGTLYYHLNFGWEGQADAWYAPPDLDAGGFVFNVIDSIIYNIYTNQTAGTSICSGRVLDSDGNPVSGAIVTARTVTGAPAATATTDGNGIYAIAASPAQYMLEAVYGAATATRQISLQECVSLDLCDESSGYFGSYWTLPLPSVGNLCDQDLVLANVASVATPVISPDSCVFHPSVTVSISCTTANALIYYTTDGTEPSMNSTASVRYTGPITLTGTTLLKARAFCSGMTPSLTATAEYTYDAAQDHAQGDYFANPISIDGLSGTSTIPDISAFTTEDGEPNHTLQGTSWWRFYNTAWFEWTAPVSGETTLTVSANRSVTGGSQTTTTRYPAFVAVYVGDTLSTIERVAVSTDHDLNYVTTLSFDAVRDTTYRIVCMLGSSSVVPVAPLTLSWNTVRCTEWYVDASATCDGNGRASSPLLSISSALARASANDTIHVLPGTYHECVEPTVAVTIIADHGPDETIIDGDGVRTCYCDLDSVAALVGFTLCNGYYYEGNGGAVYGGFLQNCVIRDSYAHHAGGGACGAVLVNCIIRDSTAHFGGGAYGCSLYGCVLVGNHSISYGGAAANAYFEYCTVFGNTSDGTAAGLDSDCHAVASIVWDNTLYDGSIENWETYPAGSTTYYTRLDYSCTSPEPMYGGTNITANPCLVYTGYPGYEDWRLRTSSPCIRPGFIDGNIGAYQGNGVDACIVTASAEGFGNVVPPVAVVDAGGSATFTAIEFSSDRPFDHFEVDGVYAGDSLEFTLSGVQADCTVKAVFMGMEFHVDAANGSDSNSGASWNEPLRTIQRAVDLNLGGEKILVRPGTYGYVVATNVTVEIVSTDGADVTTIRGTQGHRCFTAADTDTIVRGFTLRGGANTNLTGGGAFYGTLVDCVISNCTAKNGGGAVYSYLQNCLVTGNRATQAGGGVFDCELVECTVTDCEAISGGGAVYSDMRNCLVAGNRATQNGGGTYSCNLLNCTVAGNSAGYSFGGSYLPDNYQAINCIIAGNSAQGVNDLYGNGIKCFTDGDPLFVDPANGNYRLAGGSPCIDAGYTDVVLFDTDLDGNPRIRGAAVDLGCYEYSQAVSVSPGEFVESAAAQGRTVTVYADGAWSLSSDSSWLSANPSSGVGDTGVILSMTANDSGAERTGVIVLAGAGANDVVTLPVTQVEGTTGVGAYYGLFVGVNTYADGSSPLVGCVTDALAMRARCLANGLWQANDTSILTNALATKSAVRAAIASIAARALYGDTVLIYQASHGGNSLANNRDAFVCEHDGYYYDYEMASDLTAFAGGVRVIVILDTCHSAGMFRSASAMSRGGRSTVSSSGTGNGRWDFADRVVSQMEARRSMAYAGVSKRSVSSSHYASQPDVAFITAADYDQYSWDVSTGGAFTSALVQGWESGAANTDGDSLINFRELYDYAAARATGYDYYIDERTQAQCYNERLLLRTLARRIEIYEPRNPRYSAFSEWLYQNQMISFADAGNPAKVEQVANETVPGESETALYYYIVCGDQYATLADDERELTAIIEVDGQGAPVVTWRPDLNAGLRAKVREYKVLGATSLGGEWVDVTDLAPAARASAGYRFFKVTASLP